MFLKNVSTKEPSKLSINVTLNNPEKKMPIKGITEIYNVLEIDLSNSFDPECKIPEECSKHFIYTMWCSLVENQTFQSSNCAKFVTKSLIYKFILCHLKNCFDIL